MDANPSAYGFALAASFARAYADRGGDGIEREAETLARAFPDEVRADITRKVLGYKFTVYSNTRDFLNATHAEAALCVLGVSLPAPKTTPELNASTRQRRHEAPARFLKNT